MAFGQSDIIFLKNGDEIEAKVKVVGSEQVEYLKVKNLNGPVYFTDVSDLFMIKYSNGEKDVFNVDKKSIQPAVANDDDPYKGRANTESNGKEYFATDIKTEPSLTYYGIDYSCVKMVGEHGFKDLYEITDYYLGAINSQIVKESEKFDFAKAFHKEHIENDIYMLMHRNKSIDHAEVLASTPKS